MTVAATTNDPASIAEPPRASSTSTAWRPSRSPRGTRSPCGPHSEAVTPPDPLAVGDALTHRRLRQQDSHSRRSSTVPKRHQRAPEGFRALSSPSHQVESPRLIMGAARTDLVSSRTDRDTTGTQSRPGCVPTGTHSSVECCMPRRGARVGALLGSWRSSMGPPWFGSHEWTDRGPVVGTPAPEGGHLRSCIEPLD